MNLTRLALRGIAHHRRIHAGLLLGVTLACAILAGALVVGDSVKMTLRGIALARLGRVVHAIRWEDRFFSQELAGNLRNDGKTVHAAAVLALRGMAARTPDAAEAGNPLNRAHLLGVDAAFWKLAETPPPFEALAPQEAALNGHAARTLGVKAGDDITLRLARPGLMPQDAPLAAGVEDRSVSLLVTVRAVLDDDQLGRFSLSANQAAPGNVFLDRTWLQEQAGLAGLANLLLAEGGGEPPVPDCTPEQAGLRLRGGPGGTVQLESTRIFLEDAVVRAGLELPGTQPSLTYLVNRITRGDKSTPYSFVTAGGTAESAALPEDAAIISRWLADALGAAPGDTLDVAYLEIGPGNTYAEKNGRLTVHSVASMESLAAERALAPQFPGLSEVENCRDWDIGMPLDKTALADPANEAYWKQYGQTPKLIVSHATGKKLWGGRFGSVMALRFPPEAGGVEAVRAGLAGRVGPEQFGLVFEPVREQAREGVNRAMDFGGLFTGMSMFLIAAALALLALLALFALQQRASEIGVLSAMGWPRRRIRALLLLEAAPALLAGAPAGALAGAAYARTLLLALAAFWPGALANTRVEFHARPAVLAQGVCAALCCVLLVLLLAVRRAARKPARELLGADFSAMAPAAARGGGGMTAAATLVLLALALAAGAVPALAGTRSLAGPFFGAGALLLLSGLSGYAWVLGRMARHGDAVRLTPWKLALSGLARRRGRSLGIAAVTACGCFMLLSVAAMRANLALDAGSRASGTGGFAVYAETSLPVAGDGTEPFVKTGGAVVVPLRLREGDEAGCLNLNRARTPRLLGVNPETLAALGAFAPPELWGLLDMELPGGRVPALVGDSDTAMWGLQAATGPEKGGELEYRDEAGNTVTVKLAGKLPMRLSLFQGALLVSEKNFTRLYPSAAGYRVFLADAPAGGDGKTFAAGLNRDNGRIGMEAVPALERLRSFYAVETAYLAMFLVLGGLGLALGAGGVAVAVLRNLNERRAETALLHALGYPPAVIFRLALLENTALALAGLLVGAGAAAAAILPLMAAAQTGASPLSLALAPLLILAVYLAMIAAAVRLGLRGVSPADLRAE